MFVIFELLFILTVLLLIANLLHYFFFRGMGTFDNPLFFLSSKWLEGEEKTKKNKEEKK